jgi:hypothetical protein
MVLTIDPLYTAFCFSFASNVFLLIEVNRNRKERQEHKRHIEDLDSKLRTKTEVQWEILPPFEEKKNGFFSNKHTVTVFRQAWVDGIPVGEKMLVFSREFSEIKEEDVKMVLNEALSLTTGLAGQVATEKLFKKAA